MTDHAGPLTDPIVRFGDSNPFVLAALGVLHRAEQIDACLPCGPAAPTERVAGSHDLDLALLGLVSLGRRLGQLAPVQDPETREPEATQDLLR